MSSRTSSEQVQKIHELSYLKETEKCLYLYNNSIFYFNFIAFISFHAVTLETQTIMEQEDAKSLPASKTQKLKNRR